MTSMNRRTALAGIAAAIATLRPVTAAADPDARLRGLVAEWWRLERAAMATPNTEDGDDQTDRLVDAQYAVAEQIAATPTQTAEGLALKARVAVRDYGLPMEGFDETICDRLLASVERDASALLARGGVE